MRNRIVLYICILILCFLFIIVDKFIITKTFGWIEAILFIICNVLLLFSIIKFYQLLKMQKVLKVILIIISFFFIIWFSMVSIDYKRYKNLYYPLFNIGYEVKVDYDMNIQTGNIYKNKSSFYLFGIKINEINIIED